MDHQQSKRVPENHLFLPYWLCCTERNPLFLCSKILKVSHCRIKPKDFSLLSNVISNHSSWGQSQFSSVAQSCPTLWPHESQYARPPCPSPIPGVHSDSHPSSRWCHPAISTSVIPFSSCPQSLPTSESSNESTLRMRWPKYWSFSFSIIPFKENPGLISFKMEETSTQKKLKQR